MPLDKGHGPGRQLFRCDRRFLCGLGRLLCSLPRLLCVLPLDLLLLDIPGHRAALLHFRVGLHRGPVLIIRRSLDVPGLGLLYRFGRVLPDLFFHIPGCGMQGGLTNQLGSVGAFGADILMLYLIELAMHIPMNGCTRRPARLFHGAGLFWRLLLCQLFLGLVQLFTTLFHTELGLGGLLLLAFGPKLRRRKLRVTSFGGVAAKIRPLRCSSSPHKVCRLCGAPHFRGLRDILSRGCLIRPFAHGPYSPDGWSADHIISFPSEGRISLCLSSLRCIMDREKIKELHLVTE